MKHTVIELEERLPLSKRNLGKDIDNDIVRKKRALKQIFLSDPAILETLHNPDLDVECPEDFFNVNILDYIKLTPTQDEMRNFLCYEIQEKYLAEHNPKIKNQYLTIVCLIQEKDMETNYDMNRADLLACLVKENINLSNALGVQAIIQEDSADIMDNKYYAKTLVFKIKAPNDVQNGGAGKYDRFARGR